MYNLAIYAIKSYKYSGIRVYYILLRSCKFYYEFYPPFKIHIYLKNLCEYINYLIICALFIHKKNIYEIYTIVQYNNSVQMNV